jgi:hypothetical protein
MSNPDDSTKQLCDQCHERTTQGSFKLHAIAGKKFDKYFCSEVCRDAWLSDHKDDPMPVNELRVAMDKIIADREGGV